MFKKILTGGFEESVALLETGSVEISMEGWDVEALLIFIKIIHCRHSDIPRKLNLEMLAKIAVLLDYHECKEAVRFFSDAWISSLEEKVPNSTYSRELILWIWVSWFFRLPSHFGEATSTAMSWSIGKVDNLGLPIPGKVIGKPRQIFTTGKHLIWNS